MKESEAEFMAKATKVTKSKATKTTDKKVISKKVLPAGKAKAKPGTKMEKVNLEEMFRAAVSQNEEFRLDESEDYEIALEHFNKILKRLDAIIAIDPDYRDAVNYKGMMLVGCGNNEEAVACFESILKLNPADKEALNNKGIALYGLGMDEEALKCVEGAIALDNRYPDAYMNKAVILHGMGRLEDADKCIRKARALDLITG